MNPKTIIVATAAVLILLGVACLFLPREVAAWTSMGAVSDLPIQLFGGGMIAIGFLDWMGRNAIYGGIYGRPIVVANMGFGMITAFTLVSAVLDERIALWGWALVAIFAAQAVGFWRLMGSNPADRSDGA